VSHKAAIQLEDVGESTSSWKAVFCQGYEFIVVAIPTYAIFAPQPNCLPYSLYKYLVAAILSFSLVTVLTARKKRMSLCKDYLWCCDAVCCGVGVLLAGQQHIFAVIAVAHDTATAAVTARLA